MKSTGIALYVNAIIYYLIVILCPFLFVNSCGEGMKVASHVIYGIYGVSNACFEVAMVLKIQKTVNNK